MLDQYAACTCGSGKKFKWCCQAIAPGIERAMELDEAGQHDAAMRAMDDVVKANESNPQAWGRKAQLQYMQGQADAAEESLEKAFALNPKYPFGLFLRATMRFNEGEVQGALLLARRAAEVFDPEAREILASLYGMIFEAELRHNRPVAARAAIEQVVALVPGDENARTALAGVSGEESRLPLAARKKYDLMKPAAARRPAWDAALKAAPPRLSALAAAYETLTKDAADDAAAWYNLALTKAWLGDNKAAVAALEAFVEKADDERAAADAATLGEVLRCGQGMDDECDYLEQILMQQLRDPEPVRAMLQEWSQSRRLIPLPVEREGVVAALLLELTATGLVTVGRPAAEGGKLAGYLIIEGPMMRVRGPVPETFGRLRDEIRTKLALGLNDLRVVRIPPQFNDVVAEALLVPIGPGTEDESRQKALDHASRFFEDTWLHRPRKSLSNIAPVNAVGSTKLRRKVRGVVEFLKQCATLGMLADYDFGRILRKLGLDGAAPAKAASDVTAMGPAELAALKPEALSDEQLEQAYQAAVRLDAKEVAGPFAAALIGRPPQPGKTDRYPYVAFLVTKALAAGDSDAALGHIDEGMRVDCESNEGRRRNDYELRRATVLVGRGDADAAENAFNRVIQRTPRDFKARGQAAEAMLRLKQPKKALRFAEEGLKEARLANDRDADGHLSELAAAARKQGA